MKLELNPQLNGVSPFVDRRKEFRKSVDLVKSGLLEGFSTTDFNKKDVKNSISKEEKFYDEDDDDEEESNLTASMIIGCYDSQ